MSKTVRKSLVLAFSFFVVFNLSAQTGKIMFYLNPSNSPGDLMKAGEQMKKLIEKETGLDLDMEVPASHEALVAKFGEGKPCFGLLNSQSYVIANTKFGAKAKLRILRYGTGLYYGMIVTKASSGIKSLDNLNGKTIAYTDKLSTSGYLYPKKLLAKKGVKPGKTLFLNTHEEVISQVYEGKVDAGAAFYSPGSGDGELRDARARVIKKYPDVGKEVVVLAKQDPIPNDPITFSKSISSDLAMKIAVAMVKIAGTDEGKKLLKEMYGIEGLARASDGDYNSLRDVISAN